MAPINEECSSEDNRASVKGKAAVSVLDFSRLIAAPD
jgi:hypothetical protein